MPGKVAKASTAFSISLEEKVMHGYFAQRYAAATNKRRRPHYGSVAAEQETTLSCPIFHAKQQDDPAIEHGLS
jgi:hypothetical protein